MLPIGGVPILEHIVRYVRKYGFTDFLFKAHYLSDVIVSHFGDGYKLGVTIEYIIEKRPLGTIGGLSFLQNQSNSVIVLCGDVIFEMDIDRVLDFHRERHADATMVVFRTKHPADSDIVTLRGDRVTRIINKPGNGLYGNLANAAIYVFEPRVFAELPADRPFSLENEFLPTLLINGFGVFAYKKRKHDYTEDAGTPERLALVEKKIVSRSV